MGWSKLTTHYQIDFSVGLPLNYSWRWVKNADLKSQQNVEILQKLWILPGYFWGQEDSAIHKLCSINTGGCFLSCVIEYRCSIIVYKSLNNFCPSYLGNMFQQIGIVHQRNTRNFSEQKRPISIFKGSVSILSCEITDLSHLCIISKT